MKTRPQTQLETQRRPTARPLGGAEVLVAVRGPSPGEGGGKKFESSRKKKERPEEGRRLHLVYTRRVRIAALRRGENTKTRKDTLTFSTRISLDEKNI